VAAALGACGFRSLPQPGNVQKVHHSLTVFLGADLRRLGTGLTRNSRSHQDQEA